MPTRRSGGGGEYGWGSSWEFALIEGFAGGDAEGKVESAEGVKFGRWG